MAAPHSMLMPPQLIAPGPGFWQASANALLQAAPALLAQTDVTQRFNHTDLSGIRVVLPTFGHAQQLRSALATALGGSFRPPRICTMSSWLALLPPDANAAGSSQQRAVANERLMTLYAGLREHAWLKKLFGARRNTDLLPLAQTVLALADELTAALLPVLQAAPDEAELRWQAALAQLPVAARSVLSDEAQLVWSIWQSQLDADDPAAQRFTRMLQLAAAARTPLVWLTPVAPDPCTNAFLAAWGKRQPVLPILLDWRAAALPSALRQAWPEVADAAVAAADADDADADADLISTDPVRAEVVATTAGISLYPASSLEDEALCGAQTIVDWLAGGRTCIAIVAQDRVVARRIRALLQRAQIEVADETGWKLSTTRAAAALVAWFDVVSSRAESLVLLDFLKSPFVLGDDTGRADLVMTIEIALRRDNIAGGWRAVTAAAPDGAARDWLRQLAELAQHFSGRQPIGAWLALTGRALDQLGISAAFASDAAGAQIVALLEAMAQACEPMQQDFSFAEWRAYVSLQLEATAFMPPPTDQRVVMLPLNGSHLRSFDAVLMVGVDAAQLPSRASETLFFANAVRRELGLPTRESRQLQQLRDFTELLVANPTVVLSWQAHRNGEANPVSNWVARLELALAQCGSVGLARHLAPLSAVTLLPTPLQQPAPAAPLLAPQRLSASGYASLAACPYQFFAARMLRLARLDELSEQVEKRDYGDWLHRILHRYHVGLAEHAIAPAQRGDYLQAVTQAVFGPELAASGAALGFHDRWQKAMPAYLAWAAQREQLGWTFVDGEQAREQRLSWSGGSVLLHGRIDRIDADAAGAVALIDYKTSSPTALKKRIDANEDHQLAFYGLLAATPPAAAAYVSLEPQRGAIVDLEAADYAYWREQLRERIGAAMQAIAAGAGLRASGVESTCSYCAMRGLCRKGAW